WRALLGQKHIVKVERAVEVGGAGKIGDEQRLAGIVEVEIVRPGLEVVHTLDLPGEDVAFRGHHTLRGSARGRVVIDDDQGPIDGTGKLRIIHRGHDQYLIAVVELRLEEADVRRSGGEGGGGGKVALLDDQILVVVDARVAAGG